MDRLLPTVVIAVLIALALLLMVLSWRARSRRQHHLPAPTPLPDALGEPHLLVSALLLATTVAGDPLDRIAAHGLGFRAQSRVGVHDEGIVIAPTGRDAYFLTTASLRGVGRGTWTIDRTVEPGGLIVVTWILGDATLDSHFRVERGRDGDLLDAITALLPADERSPHDA